MHLVGRTSAHVQASRMSDRPSSTSTRLWSRYGVPRRTSASAADTDPARDRRARPRGRAKPELLDRQRAPSPRPRHVEAALLGTERHRDTAGTRECRRGPDHGAWHQQHAPLASACTRRAGLRPEVAVRAATSHRVMRCSRRRCGAAPAATRPPFRNDSVDRRRTLMSLVADGVSRRPRMLCDPAPTPRARCAILL